MDILITGLDDCHIFEWKGKITEQPPICLKVIFQMKHSGRPNKILKCLPVSGWGGCKTLFQDLYSTGNKTGFQPVSIPVEQIVGFFPKE